MAHKLARFALEHARCGRRFAGGSMHVHVVTHHLTYVVHLLCTMPRVR